MNQFKKKPMLTLILCLSILVSGVTGGVMVMYAASRVDCMDGSSEGGGAAFPTAVSFLASKNPDEVVYVEFYLPSNRSEVVRQNREGEGTLGGEGMQLDSIVVENYDIAILRRSNNQVHGHSELEERYSLNDVVLTEMDAIAISDVTADKTGLKIGDTVVLDDLAGISGTIEQILPAGVVNNEERKDAFVTTYMLNIPFMLIQDSLQERLNAAEENRNMNPEGGSKMDNESPFVHKEERNSIVYYKSYYENHKGAEAFIEKMTESLVKTKK